jgi:hypothetical protein
MGGAALDQLKPFPGARVNGRSCRNLPFRFHCAVRQQRASIPEIDWTTEPRETGGSSDFSRSLTLRNRAPVQAKPGEVFFEPVSVIGGAAPRARGGE